MTNQRVGSGLNNLMPFLQRDDAAPVAAEMNARPDRKADPRDRQQHPRIDDPVPPVGFVQWAE